MRQVGVCHHTDHKRHSIGDKRGGEGNTRDRAQSVTAGPRQASGVRSLHHIRMAPHATLGGQGPDTPHSRWPSELDRVHKRRPLARCSHLRMVPTQFNILVIISLNNNTEVEFSF